MTQTSSKSPPPISRFSLPKFEELPDDVRARILAVQEKAGFVPNVFMVLARRPDEFRAFFAYHDALMVKEGGGLSERDRDAAQRRVLPDGAGAEGAGELATPAPKGRRRGYAAIVLRLYRLTFRTTSARASPGMPSSLPARPLPPHSSSSHPARSRTRAAAASAAACRTPPCRSRPRRRWRRRSSLPSPAPSPPARPPGRPG